MDIFILIDSPDVREHLRNIGYVFSPTDKAYVIWKCRSISLEERWRLWEELMASGSEPALDVLPAVIDAQRRVGPERDDNDNWDHLTKEEDRLLRIPNGFAFSFPCPFQPGEILHHIGGIGGIFDYRPLRFLHSETDEYGLCAVCEYQDAFEDWHNGAFPVFDLERMSTYLYGGTNESKVF